jgi:hypothetical protein
MELRMIDPSAFSQIGFINLQEQKFFGRIYVKVYFHQENVKARKTLI